MTFSAVVIRSQTPDYQGLGLDPTLLEEGLLHQSAAYAYSTHSNGNLYGYFFPTLYYRDPDVPALEFLMKKNGGFELSSIMHELSMGNARDFAPLSLAGQDASNFVVIDHGHEYSGSSEDWPFGHVWLASESDQGFDFQRISSFPAFNHSVATGDLSGNKKDDVLVSNMGEKEGGYLINLNLYLQQQDGSFELLDATASSAFADSGSGAAAIGDVNGDGRNEIVQANYGPVSPDWGAIRVFTYDHSGNFSLEQSVPREGLFNSMGASRVLLSDLDGDGNLDIVLSMEGAYPGDALGGYTGAGLEIYENNGFGEFQRVTEARLDKYVWRGSELSFRDFEIMDINEDGFPDIILNPDSGFGDVGGFSQHDSLSDFIFINDGAGGFQQLSSDDIEIFGQESLEGIKFLRVMESQWGETDFFGMTTEGAPVHVVLQANLAEGHLSNRGVTFQEAKEFVYYHLDIPETIFDVSHEHGVTNSMLAEIYGFGATRHAVVDFFDQQGIDSLPLDTNGHGAMVDVLNGISLDEPQWLL